jgi:hypothetical protein
MLAGRVSGSRRWCAAWLVVIWAVTVVTGCSGKHGPPPLKGTKLAVFPVKGKLMMDGKPMVGAAIIFNPVTKLPKDAPQRQPRAFADENGDFTVSTYGDGDGAPAGDYKVTVSWKGADVEGTSDGARGESPEQAPEIFQTARTSKIRIKVKEEPNTLPAWDLAQLVANTP